MGEGKIDVTTTLRHSPSTGAEFIVSEDRNIFDKPQKSKIFLEQDKLIKNDPPRFVFDHL